MNTNEWQYDEWGRKFRKVGNSIEYATILETTHGSVYADELEAHQERWKQEDEKRIKEQKHSKEILQKICPFKIGKHGVYVNCNSDCVLYDDSACILTITDMNPTKDTKDRYCPISGRCKEKCAMYAHGCKLIELVKCMKHGKE